jgi:hypothetical protein
MEAEKPEAKKKSSKWTVLIIGVLILIVLMGSYLAYTNFFVGKISLPAKQEVKSNITGELAGLNPSDIKVLADWTLVKEQSLQDISSVGKSALNKSGVTDLAIWEFTYGTESLKFQVLKYASKENVSAAESDAVKPFGMTPWVLDVGPQKGIVGAYTSSSGNNPLALYFTQDNYVFFMSYYNQNGEYNATSFKSDEQFLRYIGERTLTKLSS